MTRDEERTLGRAMLAGDRSAEERLKAEIARIAFHEARRFQKNKALWEDYAQSAMVGGLAALPGWDPERAGLAYYMTLPMRAEMRQWQLRETKTTRGGPWRKSVFYRLKRTRGDRIALLEFATSLGMTLGEAMAMWKTVNGDTSFDNPDLRLHDRIGTDPPDMETLDRDRRVREAVLGVLPQLTPTQRERFLGSDPGEYGAAEKLGISRVALNKSRQQVYSVLRPLLEPLL